MAKAVFHYPIDLPNTYYRGIGEVVSRMALFEAHLMDAIALIIPIVDPKKKRVLLMSMSIQPKLGIFKSLVDNWLPDSTLKTELQKVIKGAHLLKEFRHKVAHGVWGHPEKKKKLSLIYVDEPKEVYLPKAEHIPAKQLKVFGGAIRNMDMKLLQLMPQISAALAK